MTCNHCGGEWDPGYLLNTPFDVLRESEIISGRTHKAEQIMRQEKIADDVNIMTNQTFSNGYPGRPTRIDRNIIHEAVRLVAEATTQRQEEELMNTLSVQEGESQARQIHERIRYLTTKRGDLTEREQTELDAICRTLNSIPPITMSRSLFEPSTTQSLESMGIISGEMGKLLRRNISDDTVPQKNRKISQPRKPLKRKLDI